MVVRTEASLAARAAAQKRYAQRQGERWLEMHRRHNAKWQAQNLHKHRAHQAVRDAIQRGDLRRPESCEECLKPCRPEASHDDYERPLDVEWLCRQCHARKDRKGR